MASDSSEDLQLPDLDSVASCRSCFDKDSDEDCDERPVVSASLPDLSDDDSDEDSDESDLPDLSDDDCVGSSVESIPAFLDGSLRGDIVELFFAAKNGIKVCAIWIARFIEYGHFDRIRFQPCRRQTPRSLGHRSTSPKICHDLSTLHFLFNTPGPVEQEESTSLGVAAAREVCRRTLVICLGNLSRSNRHW